MGKIRLKWFGHVQMIAINVPIRKSELIEVKKTKVNRKKLKITLVEIIKNTLLIKEVT